MKDRNLARGLFLIAVALLFGVTAATHYPIGDFARAGPGLFPVMISCLLFVIGAATVIRSYFVDPTRLAFPLQNIAIILVSLCAFALITIFLKMLAAIVALVFISTLAGSSYSVVRNAKIAVGLVLMALFFDRVLGMNLPLY